MLVGGGKLALLFHGGGPTFYVSPNGLDTNDGRTPNSAWKTPARVNAQKFVSGSNILFQGGQTFSGALVFDTTNAAGSIKIGKYGSGIPTISSGAAAAITTTNVPAVSVSGLNCVGSGDAVNGTNGILVLNTGTTKLSGPISIRNCEVSEYGATGIDVKGANVSAGEVGFDNITIDGCSVHDCTGKAGANTAAIGVENLNSNFKTCMTNVRITNNIVAGCNGYAGVVDDGGWTGTGIWAEASTNVLIEGNLVSDCGALSTTSSSPCGILTAFVDTATIRSNRVQGIKSAFTGYVDAAGIDFDLGSSNCLAEKNFVTDCPVGLLAFAAAGDGGEVDNCEFRYNIAVNCINGGFNVGVAGPITNLKVHNNVLWNDLDGGTGFAQDNSGGSVAGIVANNLIVAFGGAMVDLSAPSDIVFTGNMYFGSTFVWESVTYNTLADWQTATGQEKISGVSVGHFAEPRLVAGGFIPAEGSFDPSMLTAYNAQSGSPLLGAGLDLLAQYGWDIGTTDFFGAPIASTDKLVGAGGQIDWLGTASATTTLAATFLGRATSLDTAHQQQYNALISRLVAKGYDAKLDALYKHATDTSANALLNLVSTNYDLTKNSGTVTFIADHSMAGDGSTGALISPFNPATAAGKYSLNSAMLLTYPINTRSDDQYYAALGSTDGTNFADIYLSGDGVANAPVLSLNETDGIFVSPPPPNIQGLWMGVREPGNVETAYRNGAIDSSAANAATVLPSVPFWVCAANASSPTDLAFSPDSIAYTAWGSGDFTSYDAYMLATIINADAIALGINAF